MTTVKRLVWVGALLALVMWSLLSWGSYWLVTAGAEWLAGIGAFFALPAEWTLALEWSLRLVEQFGVVLLWVLWAIVALTIVAGAWLLTLVLGVAGRSAGAAGGVTAPRP
jgi:hypothetical protein